MSPVVLAGELEVIVELRSERANLFLPAQAGGQNGYGFQTLSHAELGPGEIARLTIPVTVGVETAEALDVSISPQARGPLARRVRHWRAKRFEEEIGAGEQAIGLVTGQLSWGGGMRALVYVDRAVPPGPPPRASANTTWKVIFKPTADELQRAKA